MKLAERALVLALGAAIGWFYVWTVRSSGDPWKFGLEQRDYYNLLIDGWLDGQLHLKVDVPEALRALPDPYDPAQRPPGLGLHDATYYRGKYYLYFGAAPVVVLMLPFRLWTGIDLPLAVATLVFAYGGFLAGTALFLAVRRRYFPAAGPGVVAAGVVALGLAGLWPVLLRRPHMWELPIAAGSCFALLALWCVWRSLHVPRAEAERPGVTRRVAWFAGAGLALGLAIASRPTYLIAGPFLAVPVLAWWWRAARERAGTAGWLAWGRALPGREVGGALVPLLLIGAAMAWHNQARFGHPLQFGQAYQLSLDYESKMAHFRLNHAPFNVWRYFFSGAEWSRHFPFIAPAPLPPKPPGFGGHDDVYGLLANLPVAWLALAAPLALRRRDRTERAALGTWLATTGVLFAGMAGTLILFFGSLARYQSDFAPALLLLAATGLLAAHRELQGARMRAWRVTGALAGGALVLFSGGFAILYSLQLDGLLREHNPRGYREVARAWNRFPAVYERLAGVRYGPVELGLRVDPETAGPRELLLQAGAPERADRIWLVRRPGGQGWFEIEAADGRRQATPPVRFEPAKTHRLVVSMGSLLPSDTHPLFAGASETEVGAVTRRLLVRFDDRTLLDQVPWPAAPPAGYRPASPRDAAPGAGSAVVFRRQDATVLPGWRAEASRRAQEAARWLTPRAALILDLEWPRGRAGAKEPLVVTGEPGRGDFVAVEYLDGDGTARFLFDHWGGALQRSEPVRIEPGRRIRLRVAMESLRLPLPFRAPGNRVGGQLDLAVDGQSVWRVAGQFFVVNPVEIAIGRNPIGGTTCGPEFSGVIHGAAPDRAPR
jgi:hypothetical protein